MQPRVDGHCYYPRPNDQLLHQKSRETNKTKTHEPCSPRGNGKPPLFEATQDRTRENRRGTGKGGGKPAVSCGCARELDQGNRHGAPAAADQCPQEEAVKSEPACAGYRGNRSSSLASGHPRHTTNFSPRKRLNPTRTDRSPSTQTRRETKSGAK